MDKTARQLEYELAVNWVRSLLNRRETQYNAGEPVTHQDKLVQALNAVKAAMLRE